MHGFVHDDAQPSSGQGQARHGGGEGRNADDARHLNAQYTHVLGVDGIVDKRRAGTRQLAPGKRRMLFACSHHAGAISVVEMTLKLEEGKRYLVEAEAFTGPPVYVVDEVPGRKEIARQQAPLFGAGMSQRGNVLDDVIARYGWRRED